MATSTVVPGAAVSRRSRSSRAARAEVTTGGPLWGSRHLLVVAGLNALGAVLIAVGWYQGSGEARVNDMLDWLNVGIAGLIVIGAANALHVLRGRRTVGQARQMLLAQVPRYTAAPVRARVLRREVEAGDHAARLPSDVVAAEGMSHYHLATCPLAAGKDTTRGSVAEFSQAGLTGCEVCEP